MREILKSSLSSRALFVWATSAILAPVLIQNSSIAQPARAWGPGETPTQAASRVVTDEQVVNVNGVDKAVKKGEVINSEEGAKSVNGLSTNAISIETGKEAVLQDGTRILKDGTLVNPDGSAVTKDGTIILPDGREEVKREQAVQGQKQSILAPDSSGQTQGGGRVQGGVGTPNQFVAELSCFPVSNGVNLRLTLTPLANSVQFFYRDLVYSFSNSGGTSIPNKGVIVPVQSPVYIALNLVPGLDLKKSSINVRGTVNGAVVTPERTTAYTFIIGNEALLTAPCN
jgi:hypothetical protein